MLYAIAVYRYNDQGKLQKIQSAPKPKGMLSSDPLNKMEHKTLPLIEKQHLAANQIHHFHVGNEHHYLIHQPNDNVRVIVSRKALDDTECSYLFHNSRYIPLDDILANPLGYTGRDASCDKLHNNLAGLKVELLKVVDSLLERGEKLEDLSDRSLELKLGTDDFLKEAKKQNACCTYF